MNLLYFGLGAALLVGVVVDLLWTTLWVEGGAGPLTTRLMQWVWTAARGTVRDHPRALSLTGPFVLTVTTAGWLVCMWAGWTLVFASADLTLIDTVNENPVSWADRLYFTGYTIFTLGIGDYVPRDGVWQIATVLATASGMLFVTLNVTYFLSVLDAVSQKRAFASDVTGLGMHGEAVVRTGWDGDDFRSLDLPLNSFVAELNTLTANHKAYPILHYFYSVDDQRAAPVSVAVLDEALTILRFGVPESHRPNAALVDNARSSVESYIQVLDSTIPAADRTPPPPDVDSLRQRGIPVVAADEFDETLDQLADRRRMLLGIVDYDAREWPHSTTES